MGLGDDIRIGVAEDLEKEASRKILNAIIKWREGVKTETAKKRWIFELIQNAIDLKNDNLKIEIIHENNKVVFRHNAGPFSPKELRALVYAYSTKPYERDSEYTGRFSTGFLVTHIINRRVELNGFVANEGEKYHFKTIIDRVSDNKEEISQNIHNCFAQINNSTKVNAQTEFWTEYIYEAADEIGKNAIKEGILELKKTIPFLFAFNRLKSIVINQDTFEEDIENPNDELVSIGPKQVRIKKDGNIQIGILVENKKGQILHNEEIARIFVKGLPLIETADYVHIPFIIHSSEFDTTEERDTITDVPINRDILDKAFKLYFLLVDEIAKTDPKPSGLQNLVSFSNINENRVQNNLLWKHFNDLIKNCLKIIVDTIPLVKTIDDYKDIKSAIFPIRKIYFDRVPLLEQERFIEFYNIINEIKNNIPYKDDLEEWLKVVSKIKEEFDFGILLYTIENLRDELRCFVQKTKDETDYYPSLETLQTFNLTDPKQFLIRLFGLINNLYKEHNIDSADFIELLLPDQKGVIGPYKWNDTHLHLDRDIPDDFKDIIDRIGWDIRLELVHSEFAEFEIVKDYVKDTLDTEKIIKNLTLKKEIWPDENIKDEEWNEDKIKGWIEFVRWSVLKKQLVEGFPIITKDKKRAVIELDKECLLVPFKFIGIEEKFEEIYPDSRIMHEAYFSIEDQELLNRFITAIANYKSFVTNLPVYKEEVNFGYNKLRSVLVSTEEPSKVDHKTTLISKNISIMPFWEGVIGRISEFQDRARLLFEFIIKHIINVDKSWEREIEVNCSCGEQHHIIRPSHWLASLKSDAWIPVKTLENDNIVKREATKESIEKLFSEQELDGLIKYCRDGSTIFLTQFGFDELDLKIRLESIETGRDKSQIRKVVAGMVDILKTVPEITYDIEETQGIIKEAIQFIIEKHEKSKTTSENKLIGENLEKVIEELVKKEKINVKPIFRGGDLEMWQENEGWDSGLVEIGHYFMEIKFTSSSRAHLSKVQAEKARETKNYYSVLVVKNAENLRELLKETGQQLNDNQELINLIIENSYVVENFYNMLGTFPNPDEIEPDINGYWIKNKLWNNKVNLPEWLKLKFS